MRGSRGLVALALVLCLVAVSCSRTDNTASSTTQGTGSGSSETTAPEGPDCTTDPPKATELGVSADSITVTVSADTGSPAAPGLFQGNIDALVGYAKYINAKGGIACRQLVVKPWDTKLSSDEAKNGQIDACLNSLAMVGSNVLFSPDNDTLTGCKDKAGKVTGLPDLAALAADSNEQCNPTTYIIQSVYEPCPIKVGRARDIVTNQGISNWFAKEAGEKLHGAFIIPGDLPTTVQASMPTIASQELAGITFDDKAKVSGLAEQSAYTPIIQKLRSAGSNYVYDGSNDKAMVNIRKEAKAQGLDSIKLWTCSLACYSPLFTSSGGSDVDGTYASFGFLPFEEKDQNETLAAYLDSVDKPDAFGAQAWQAAVTFKQAIDGIVEKDGINGITRASLLDALANIGDIDAGGWMGKKSLRGTTPCFLIMQLEGGKWVRRYPEKAGTMDCDPKNLGSVNLDPAAEAAKLK